MPAEAPTAFFSYSREDLDFALRLAKDLKKAGANVWMDKLDIRPGQVWANKVEAALDNCRRLLVILSPSSVNSPNVMAEVAFALDEQKEVIPVVYRECRIPFRLRPFQYVDFRTDYSQGLAELLDTVGVEQQAAASAAAASPIPIESQPAAPDADKDRVASEQARMEQERQAAEQARLEKARIEAAEQARLAEERRQAAERARLEAERTQAAEKARVEREERERLAAAEKLRLEQEERERQAAAQKARLEQEERERLQQERARGTSAAGLPSLFSRSPAWTKIALAACGILVVALVLYWAKLPKPQERETQTKETKTETSNVSPSTQGSSGSAAGDKVAIGKPTADKTAPSVSPPPSQGSFRHPPP